MSCFFLLIALMHAYALRQFDAAEAVQDPHDLFLIDHDAVGLVEHLLHDRVRVVRLLAAVLAARRTRPPCRLRAGRGGTAPSTAIRSRMLSGFIRFSSSRMPSHSSWNTPLASPRCSSSYVSSSSSGNFMRVDVDAARPLDELDAVVEHREVPQAEEVHLEHADLLEDAHLPLRRHRRRRRPCRRPRRRPCGRPAAPARSR